MSAVRTLQELTPPRTKAVAMDVWKKVTNGMDHLASVHQTAHFVVKPSCQTKDMQPSNALKNLQTYD